MFTGFFKRFPHKVPIIKKNSYLCRQSLRGCLRSPIDASIIALA